jgi:hypothetical protein
MVNINKTNNQPLPISTELIEHKKDHDMTKEIEEKICIINITNKENIQMVVLTISRKD